MRLIPLNAIVLAIACALSAAGVSRAADAPLLTAGEARDVKAVLDSMIAAGFPDTAKSTVYVGDLSVSATFDPAKGMPLPSSASKTQMSVPNSTKMTYGYAFGGLHFKLADGSWVISLSYRFKPGPGDSVGTASAKEVTIGTLTADAMAAFPFDAEKMAGGYLNTVAPGERERAKNALTRIVPINRFLQLGADSAAPAAVLLYRAGWNDAIDTTVAMAQQRSRSYWQLRPWTVGADYAFDPTLAYPKAGEEESVWKAAQKTFTSEPPATALRRALFRWCRAEMMAEEPEDVLLPLDVAAAAAKAAVDPNDPQNNAARIDALAAGMRLPVTVAANASLTARLQSWEGRPRRPRMMVSSGNGGLQFSTSFTAPPLTYTPDKADLDALVALLADERPSRFSDFAGSRTLGDNAWRALATLLKSDPRALAHYPTDHPWTTAERTAAAKAVQAWWKDHRKEFVEK